MSFALKLCGCRAEVRQEVFITLQKCMKRKIFLLYDTKSPLAMGDGQSV